MDELVQATMFGKDHEQKGRIHVQDLAPFPIALGTSAGVRSKPNEDAVGVSVLGAEFVLAIADGHWGRDASEIAIAKAIDLIRPDGRPAQESETRARLFALYEQVNTELYRLAVSGPGAPAPETTLIVCHVSPAAEGIFLCWASFGDSYLFLQRDGELRQLNTLQSRWLGYLSRLSENAESRSILMRFLSEEARYMGVAGGLETGIEPLEPRDALLLCTDGLIGSDCGPAPAVLTELADILASDLSPGARLEGMIASALDRGEQDNISCAAAVIS